MRSLGGLALAMVVVLLIRSTALSPLAARGIVLDALAFATVIWSLGHGAVWGATFGFVLGLAADLDATHWLGRHALVLSLVGYAVGRLARTLVRESPATHLALLMVAVMVHQAWVLLFEFGGLAGISSGGLTLARRVLVSALATAPAGTLLLLLVRRLLGRPLFGHVLAQSG